MALPEILAFVALIVVAVVSPKVALAEILALFATKEPSIAIKCAATTLLENLPLSPTTEFAVTRFPTVVLPTTARVVPTVAFVLTVSMPS